MKFDQYEGIWINNIDVIAGLAMETSKAEPSDRNQAKAKLDQKLSKRSKYKHRCEEKLNQLMKMNQTLREEKMKQLVRKDVNNSGVESAVEEVNKPDFVVKLLTYQMLINRGESAVGTMNKRIHG
ncbi:transmembrane and coiled-coil domain-containing protein 4-like [Dorcoceras hygrometricum]|uniref:Transmembrane and coiled-coil domain-containing protein 4-like n=1 Tax=Dorcoceras hygrometricum TaxID=472368 RepID=A0A2Z7BCQ9_9LAMI|nr:transmembrane and coiled-coil domain-containing protein 4-like [Dorcoceras hygrometricum]